MADNTYAGYVKHWGDLVTSVAALPELAHLEWLRSSLEAELEGLKDLSVRQASLKRQAQEASRELSGHVKRGRDMATRMRDSLKGYYGRDGEMLVEFQVQPRRPRTAPTETPAGTEDETPTESGPNPAQTAAPVTDASPRE